VLCCFSHTQPDATAAAAAGKWLPTWLPILCLEIVCHCSPWCCAADHADAVSVHCTLPMLLQIGTN